MKTAASASSLRLFDLDISTLDTPSTIARLVEMAGETGGDARLATYLNPHTILQARADPRFAAELARFDLRYPDGIGLVWASRWIGPGLPERVTASDFLPDFCREAAREALPLLFFLGGEEGVARAAATRLETQAPGLRVVGTHHGYIDGPEAASRVAEQVAASGARVCIVAMGSPRQERWMLEHGSATGAALLWAVGGALDFHSGHRRRAPALVQRLGLEWAFRLALEPRRLAHRYLVGNARFALATLAEGRRSSDP